MKILLKYLLAAFAILPAISCTEEILDLPSHEECKEVLMPVSFFAVPQEGSLDTKAYTGTSVESDEIMDVWIIEYNLANGIMVGVPKYYEAAELKKDDGTPEMIPVILPPQDSTYAFIAIANTHTEDLGSDFTNANLLSKLDDVFKSLTPADNPSSDPMTRLYNENSGKIDLTMSGRTDITNVDGSYYIVDANGTKSSDPTTSLAIKLFRNVAKLTVEVTNAAGSGVKVQSIQVKNVPDKLYYAERLRDFSYAAPSGLKDIGYYTSNPIPKAGEVALIDYSPETCVLSQGDPAVPFIYYLPRNCRGQATGSTAVHMKNKWADKLATYVEVMAEAENGTAVRYRFYIGEDMESDCNVMPNHHYTLRINISDDGSLGMDSRVENMGGVTLTESNCYLINPVVGYAQPVYAIPATDRSNRYWGTVRGHVEGEIYSNTEWVAEVIWQDTPERLIYFCDEKGTILPEDVFSKTGQGNLHFKPTGKHGNVLIGIKKKNAGYDEYLWSWHLWITDYAPDERKGYLWETDKYIYPVSNGEVHRYDDAPPYEKDGALVYYTQWSYIYKNKYIMDRNLGALKARTGTAAEVYQMAGMVYQYGRKDPFPWYTSSDKTTLLYDITGADLKGRNAYAGLPSNSKDYVSGMAASGGDYDKSIQSPYTYYNPGSGKYDWANNNPYNDATRVWDNPSEYRYEIATEGEASDKSLFDPCPAGWKIPHTDCWTIFEPARAVEKSWADVAGGIQIDGINIYIGNSTKDGAPTAYYPLAGYRNLKGVPEAVDRYGAYWSSTASGNTERSTIMNISANAHTINRGADGRGFGGPVRCVEE